MDINQSHPRWWLLSILMILTIVAFWLERNAHITENSHRAIEVGIVLVCYGLVWLWLDFSEKTIFLEEYEKNRQELRRSLTPVSKNLALEQPLSARRNGKTASAASALFQRVFLWISHITR